MMEFLKFLGTCILALPFVILFGWITEKARKRIQALTARTREGHFYDE